MYLHAVSAGARQTVRDGRTRTYQDIDNNYYTSPLTTQDPRACISSFFTKIQVADQDYRDAFYSELEAFKTRIVKRAKEKIEEAMEEERQERLGPGGLDTADVFESLPESMKNCFESQDIGMLQQVIKDMPEDEAR